MTDIEFFYRWIPAFVAAALMGLAAIVLRHQIRRDDAAHKAPPRKPDSDSHEGVTRA